MSSVIPNISFFEFAFRAPKQASPIRIDGRLGEWSMDNRVPDLMHLKDRTPFSQVYLSWNEEGLYIGWRVQGKRKPVEVDAVRFWRRDCLELWIDLRNDKSRRRYSEHCHHFFLLPRGHKEDRERAIVGECREPGGPIQETVYDHRGIEVASLIRKTTYALEARIPRDVIPTYDPSHHPIIGFNYHVTDTDGRAQWWSCGPDLPRHIDPSTWGAVELVE